MPQDHDFATVVRQIVRGERPPTDLALVGPTLKLTRNGRYALGHPSRDLANQTVLVTVEDVAAGLVAHFGDRDALDAWGTILMTYDGVSVDEDDESRRQKDFNLLWGAAWDASFRNEVQQEALRRARQLVEGVDE